MDGHQIEDFETSITRFLSYTSYSSSSSKLTNLNISAIYELIIVIFSESSYVRGAVLAPGFVRPKKIILIKRRGNSVKQKLLEMVKVTVWLHTIFVWFYKNENGLKTAPKPRLGRQN